MSNSTVTIVSDSTNSTSQTQNTSNGLSSIENNIIQNTNLKLQNNLCKYNIIPLGNQTFEIFVRDKKYEVKLEKNKMLQTTLPQINTNEETTHTAINCSDYGISVMIVLNGTKILVAETIFTAVKLIRIAQLEIINDYILFKRIINGQYHDFVLRAINNYLTESQKRGLLVVTDKFSQITINNEKILKKNPFEECKNLNLNREQFIFLCVFLCSPCMLYKNKLNPSKSRPWVFNIAHDYLIYFNITYSCKINEDSTNCEYTIYDPVAKRKVEINCMAKLAVSEDLESH
jgi:hypothetical protein